ncbi:acyl carrier protein [Actinomadura rubrisoli]|uniref:Acyl carrier protein n=1 Tax=Actinomadura rubrisoli TaxID=2530368 RepID=A0A4R5AUB5_9ACTN|nr:acyl carrier protein [Actinomadura rubrisoli]TDD76621.1 acyl carrier protein [Actinomadura rubrisoli]
MKELTLDELKDALRTAAGEAGTLDGTPDILDAPFPDLGYDSLAIMETTAQVERRFGVKLPEEEAAELETPREYLAFVNARIAEAV